MASVLGQRCPIVTLDNGLTVVNYGSNHQYKFNTGEVLEACSDDVCRETSLISKHDYDVIVQDNNGGTFRFTLSNSKDNVYYNTTDKWKEYIMKVFPQYKNNKMWLDVFINYQISDRIQDDLVMLGEMDIIDIILVPYPLMNAWSQETRIHSDISKKMTDGVVEFYNNWEIALSKMRTCKLEDRVTKIIYSDQFCGSDELRELKVLPLSEESA